MAEIHIPAPEIMEVEIILTMEWIMLKEDIKAEIDINIHLKHLIMQQMQEYLLLVSLREELFLLELGR